MDHKNPNEFDRAFVGKPGCMIIIILIIIIVSIFAKIL